MIPVPPLDGGNVLAGVLPETGARLFDRLRPYGFLILYGLLLHGPDRPHRVADSGRDPRVAAVTRRKRVVSGMRPTGRLHLGHLVGALHNWVDLQREYDAFYFVADWHALTSEYASTGAIVGHALDNVADWIGAGYRSRAEHVLRAVARARARRAVPAAADDHADPLAGARADLQGADGAARREGPVDHRVPRLSAAADGRRDHLRRAFRAGRRGPGAAPGAVARGRPPVPPLLRRGVRRAAAAADADAAAAGPRQPQDEQELREHDRSGRPGRGRRQEGPADVHGPEADSRRHPRHRRGQSGVRLSRRVQPTTARKSRT